MSHLQPKTHQIKLIRLKQNNIENQHSSDMETTSLDVLVLQSRGVLTGRSAWPSGPRPFLTSHCQVPLLQADLNDLLDSELFIRRLNGFWNTAEMLHRFTAPTSRLSSPWSNEYSKSVADSIFDPVRPANQQFKSHYTLWMHCCKQKRTTNSCVDATHNDIINHKVGRMQIWLRTGAVVTRRRHGLGE